MVFQEISTLLPPVLQPTPPALPCPAKIVFEDRIRSSRCILVKSLLQPDWCSRFDMSLMGLHLMG